MELNKKFIAAISGGPDSMALLSFYRNEIIAICTINYKKRVDSDFDVNCVKQFAAKLNIPIYILDVVDEIYLKYPENNFQNQARQIRYDFFNEIAKKVGVYNLLIAHNLNDWLETAIMQENRKTNNLYYGINKISNFKKLIIYRPLILIPKKELQNYCEFKQIKYAIDSTNLEDHYERNKIRIITSNWTKNELNNKILMFKKINNSYYQKQEMVYEIFDQWTKTDFEISFFNKINEDILNHVVYEYLKTIGEINKNKDKIKGIIEFLKIFSKNKKYRLENNKFLKIENEKIKIVK